MDNAYVSFPQRPADDAVPAMSKLYHSVHRRLASIVTNAAVAAVVDHNDEGKHKGSSTDPQDIPSSSKESGSSLIDSAGAQSFHPVASSASLDVTPTQASRKSSVSFELNIPKPSKALLLPAGKAAASVQTEPLTVLGDMEYLESSVDSPSKESSQGLIESTANAVPGFALQREISSESEAPPSPGRKRRPSLSREDSISTVLTRLKSGRLSKEFWMKDQNAHVCFRCESPFNSERADTTRRFFTDLVAFRRKHHCRLCGQIFCSNCTLLSSGGRARQRDRIRTCKTCNRIMDEYANRSSDSELDALSEADEPSIEVVSTPTTTLGARERQFSMPELMKPAKTPLMAIPATRLPIMQSSSVDADQLNGSSTPSRAVVVADPLIEQQRHPSLEEIVPHAAQQSGTAAMMHWSQGLMGDFATSAANPFRRMTAHGDQREGDPVTKGRVSSDSSAFSLEKSPLARRRSSEDDDDYWGGTIRISSPTEVKDERYSRSMPHRTNEDQAYRRVKRRGTVKQKHMRTKSKSLVRHGGNRANESPSLLNATDTGIRGRTRSRSNSVIQLGNEYLDSVSITHLGSLLQQMLSDAQADNPEAWQTCLQPILMKIANNIQPKVKEGASGYINNYVKIKRIPGARPSDCEFLSGAVFTHKLAHKRMSRTITSPRIMLIAFPLEYHRADSSQLLSLEPVMAQEKEYLRNLVKRIMALRPTLILVQNSISGLALEYLLDNQVTVAYLVKESAMAIVSGLTGADIITSVDRLAFEPRIGRCESFSVRTFVHHDAVQPFKKTYFYFRGCPPDLGCSIVLRGGTSSILEKIKRIVEMMVFIVYNLKLETSLLRDHFASPQALTQYNPTEHALIHQSQYGNEILLSLPMQSTLAIFEHRILSASPGVRFPPPYLVKKAADLETRLAKHKAYQDYLQTDELLGNPPEPIFFFTDKQQQDVSDLTIEQQENVKKLMEAAELRKLNQELQHCKSQWKTFLEREIKEHRRIAYPQDRQAISVLYSAVCSETGTPCTMPTTEEIQFYKDTANDIPLGQYVEESVYSAMKPCPTILCGRRNMDHHRSYVHAQARVSVITETYLCPLPGMQNTILMWNYCKKCDAATPLMTMSENSWSYSFGKYLEVTFYDQNIQVRADNCTHNLCRDHVRYFGFRDMAIRFDYDPVAIMGLALPQPFVDWQPDTFVRLKNEEYKSIQFKITAFYASLEFRLYNMNSETLVIEQADAYKSDLSQMRVKAKDERTYLLNLLQEIFENSAPLEYLCLNRALRVTQDKVTSWNETFDDMERLYLPSEKDIRRLTTAHLRKLFSLDDGSRISLGDEEMNEIEGKRSVSAPVVPIDVEKAEDIVPSDQGPQLDPASKATLPVELPTSERTVSMPMIVAEDDDEEPRGFHPRRTYEHLIKSKTEPMESNQADEAMRSKPTSDLTVSGFAAAPGIKLQASGIPKLNATSRSALEDGNSQLNRETNISVPSRSSSRSPSIDHKNAVLSSIPILKSAHDPMHLRKKSMTNNHLLSKQIQDIGESIVGSVEKRWNEQKRFSAQTKDQPQKNKAGDTKVTSLAKHFEQLTREFEKERLRTRRMLHSRGRPTFAVATQKPRVAVFDNVDDAVDELSDEEEPNLEPLLGNGNETLHYSNPATEETTPNRTPLQLPLSPMTVATKEIPDQYLDEQQSKLAVEHGKAAEATGVEKKPDIDAATQSLVPAAERNTLMKTLSNFWADRTSSNWTPLEYPLPPSEHMFLESDVVVREDEPSSLIAFTLSAQEYVKEITHLREASKRRPNDVDNHGPLNLSTEDRRIRATLQNPTGIHMRFAWGGDKSTARLTSRIFYAEQFDALRRFCGCDENYVTSLSRCVKWDSSGGKSGSAFLKTQDDRLIVKQLSKIETEQFLRFAPNYFEYMSDNFFNKLPVSLCKILGFYQITSKNPVTGRFMKMDVIVMENLFYKRKTTRIFDLKGSMRNRKVQQTGKENEVLLDENFVEREYLIKLTRDHEANDLVVSENPLFVRDHARRFLKSALHNDTLFLAQNNVMDYSLIIGIDDERHELIVGIIDFIRTYTWDKKLESWVKERGLVGGGSAKPTVVTPKMYKTRFREAMDRYIFGIK